MFTKMCSDVDRFCFSTDRFAQKCQHALDPCLGPCHRIVFWLLESNCYQEEVPPSEAEHSSSAGCSSKTSNYTGRLVLTFNRVCENVRIDEQDHRALATAGFVPCLEYLADVHRTMEDAEAGRGEEAALDPESSFSHDERSAVICIQALVKSSDCDGLLSASDGEGRIAADEEACLQVLLSLGGHGSRRKI